jgi:alkylhydroperoxidase family enzyme
MSSSAWRLRGRCDSAPRLTAIIDDAAAELSPADAAIVAFAEKVARDATTITETDVRVLREHGLSDAEIFDVAAAAAARSFFSKLLDALGVAPDSQYGEVEDELRRRLTVGRPIDASAAARLPTAETPDARGHR